MTSRVIQRNIRISHRKASLVIDLIRNKPVSEAIRILKNTHKKFAAITLKLLNSAISNVSHNQKDMNPNKLYVYEIFANQGPTIKRTLPRAKGSADQIFKRTTHLEIVLSDDVNERKNQLQKIKEKITLRANNNGKKKEENNQVVSSLKKEDTKKTKIEKKQEVKQPKKEETKKVEQVIDPEVLKREQEQLKVVDQKDDQGKEITTENIIISVSEKVSKVLFDEGDKNVLFYKMMPANQIKRVLVYVTAPVKKVIGEFDLLKFDEGAVSTL